MISPLVYTACDQAYLDAHGDAFRKSAEVHGMKVRIDLVRDDDPDFFTEGEKRVFYCYKRWLMLPEVIRKHGPVLVVDIDSVFNEGIEIHPSWDLGLFFRPHCGDLALKICCAASYWNETALPFADVVRNKILKGPKEWGWDQAAIYLQYLRNWQKYRVLRLDDSFLNYRFDKDAKIWSAKGPFRKDNPAYLERRARYAA